MSKTKKQGDAEVTPCSISPAFANLVIKYAEHLKNCAHSIGGHDLSEEEFNSTGLFRAAIERLRGQQAATMTKKREFIDLVLSELKSQGKIASWNFEGSANRHDYCVTMNDGWVSVIEAKGCMDGNNTTIYERPQNADEFIIWSLCQNPGSDLRKGAWSGIIRIGNDIVARQQLVDGLIVWDMLCGTIGRPCPKMQYDRNKIAVINNRTLPPPCIYLFPRSVPEVKNNPSPPCHQIKEVKFLKCLHDFFEGKDNELVLVKMQVRLNDVAVERKTTLIRAEQEITSSDWTEIKRA